MPSFRSCTWVGAAAEQIQPGFCLLPSIAARYSRVPCLQWGIQISAREGNNLTEGLQEKRSLTQFGWTSRLQEAANMVSQCWPRRHSRLGRFVGSRSAWDLASCSLLVLCSHLFSGTSAWFWNLGQADPFMALHVVELPSPNTAASALGAERRDLVPSATWEGLKGPSGVWCWGLLGGNRGGWRSCRGGGREPCLVLEGWENGETANLQTCGDRRRSTELLEIQMETRRTL